MQRWRQRGIGPRFVRLGNVIRYRERDIETFIEERTDISTADAGRCAEPS